MKRGVCVAGSAYLSVSIGKSHEIGRKETIDRLDGPIRNGRFIMQTYFGELVAVES
jgi:hypothetical protein